MAEPEDEDEGGDKGASATEQAIGTMGPFSVLLFAALLGLAGACCRMLASWVTERRCDTR